MTSARFNASPDQRNYATGRFENNDGTLDVIEYAAPAAGGYVRLMRSQQQVCRGLSMRGATLEWDGQGALVDLLRREWKRARAADRREAQRYGRA